MSDDIGPHCPHRIKSADAWNERIPTGTTVVVDGITITKTAGRAIDVRTQSGVVTEVVVGGRHGLTPISRLTVPARLAGMYAIVRPVRVN